jgi:hypothetical protein
MEISRRTNTPDPVIYMDDTRQVDPGGAVGVGTSLVQNHDRTYSLTMWNVLMNIWKSIK